MTDTAPAAPAAVSASVAEFEFPNLTGKRSFDCALVPTDVRLDFLKGAIRTYIANRLNGVHTRHLKDETVAAWNAYDEATKADALQTVVPKPDGERPAAPDYEDAYTRAIADLTAGSVRRQSAEPKPRKTKDPLISVVTEVVAREVFESRRAADPKYSYLHAKKEVGVDGIVYLNALIDAKVAGGADRAALEKMRDTKYINPAKAMLGITTTKAVTDLPSIL
jgi:hypothetical protein